MNFRDLEYLVAVAELRHFGKAAERCHVSQPTLSIQLKKLETYLDVHLFERINKEVMITPVGEKILNHAKHILQDAQEIKKTAKTAHDPLAGDFRLGTFPTLAPYFLPLVVPAIIKKFPKLKLFLIEEKTGPLMDKLKMGNLDAALVALPIEDEALSSIPLFKDPFLLAVPLGHPLAKRKHVEQHDIRGERLLLLEEGHCLRNQALEVCSRIGASESEDFRATSLETLRQMVASGLGVTLMPQLAMRKKDGIAYIPFDKPKISRTIGLIYRKASPRNKCIEVMASLMSRIYSGLYVNHVT